MAEGNEKNKSRKKRGGLRIIRNIIIVLILLAAAAGGAYAWWQSGYIQVEQAKVERGSVQEVIEETGVMAAENTSTVTAKTNFDVTGVKYSIGDEVAAGSIMLTTDVKTTDYDVKSLQAQVTGLEAQLTQAKRHTEQMQILFGEGSVSENEYTTALTAEKELAAQIDSLNYTIKSTNQNISELEKQARVKAPISGTVTDVFVSYGDSVTAGSPLFEISDMSSIYIKASLMADDAAKVMEGQQVILVDIPDVPCSIRKIYPKTKEEATDLGIVQKRVEMEIAMDGQVQEVLGGDIDLRIITDSRENVMVVPKQTVFSEAEKDYVFTIEGEQVTQREVIVGLKGLDYYEIVEGVSDGEKVVISPDPALKNGSRIKVQGI